MRWIKIIIGFILFLCFVSIYGLVEADSSSQQTVNDLFKLYNEAELVELKAAEKEYMEAVKALQDMENNAEMTEIYNDVIEEVKKSHEAKKIEITKNIDELFEANLIIQGKIEEDIYGDWDVLMGRRNQIIVNNNRISELIDERSKFNLADKREFDYSTIEDLEKEVREKELVYEEAVDVATLGEVTNAKYPLGKATKVNSKYGYRINPVTGSGIKFHSGIDLYAITGTEVLSAFNGVISNTGYSTACGYFVTINHGNGLTSYYCHLSEIKCEKGQKVRQYDVIALSGNTGTQTTGAHLHFALYIDGVSIDPGVLYKE